MSIPPDTKNWTWVIERPCPQCGFDATAFPRETVGQLLRENAVAWQGVLLDEAVRERPAPDVWSPLEYSCHVRDVFGTFDGRFAQMLEQDDPLFTNWDQDATAVEQRYAEQDPATVLGELAAAAEAAASRLDAVHDQQWARTGRRSDGSEFTVESLARYFVHDPVHHLYDVTGVRATSAGETQYRAVFDADVTFSNGGGLNAAEPHRGTRGGPSDERAADRARRGPGRRLVDLSHVITAGMTTYPGLPAPQITPYLTREASRASYAVGTEFALDMITLIGNTGTYLDSPFHRYPDGTDLASLSLDSLVDLPAVVVRTAGTGVRAVDVDSLAAMDVAGRAVLLHTGGDADWGTPAYAHDAPYLTDAGARWLVDHGARLVGIDAINIDNIGSGSAGERPAHSRLLAAGIPVVEHLTGLAQLPPLGARFTAVPPRVAEFGTFPVRAFAAIP